MIEQYPGIVAKLMNNELQGLMNKAKPRITWARMLGEHDFNDAFHIIATARAAENINHNQAKRLLVKAWEMRP